MSEPLSEAPAFVAAPTYPILRTSRWALRAGALVWILHEIAVLFFLDGDPNDSLSFSLSHYIGIPATLGRLFNVLLRAFVLLAMAEAIQLALEIRAKLLR